MDILAAIRNDPRLEELTRLLDEIKGPVTAEGLWGSSAPILAALAAERLNRPLLLVTAHSEEADDCRDDVETAVGVAPELFPQLDIWPPDPQGSDELIGERLRLCLALMGNAAVRAAPERGPSDGEAQADRRPPQIVASIMALMQPVPTAAAIAARSLTVDVGLTLDPETLSKWLTEHGFNRCDAVDMAGDFARRGGIVDVFSNAHTDPVRIEFFGDTVESIRLVDLGTQRSTHTLHSVQIPSLRLDTRGPRHAETGSFLSLLPENALIALYEPREIQELGRTYWERMGEPAGLISVNAVLRQVGSFAQLHLARFGTSGEDVINFEVGSLPQFEPKSSAAIEGLRELARENDVFVLCDNVAEEKRLVELLHEPPPEAPVPADGATALTARPLDPAAATAALARIRTAVGVIQRGFQWGRTAYVPHHELFHRYRQRRTLRRVQPARPLDSFFDLEKGDFVVHTLHGIGRFLGLKSLERGERRDEYLALEFADKAVVHVPISQIDVVQKYIGTFRGKPKLSKVGGLAWKRAKARVAEAVVDMAGEMLGLQAQRETDPGIAYPQDTAWQREFEDSFLFTETEDQLRALADVKADMTRSRPMDRLLCGDVGYGKTELAMRAAFKVVEYGKQVAVLVPTTVLAAQHFQTFSERMADYPFSLDVLSRFRSKGEQAKIIEHARKGQIDILIGTHRLLSSDVHFADLGLIVIDEEQRFGVEAKEKLKRMRATVDVLTLSATPIPRTLHMAMLGIRDISSLATPPLDRRSIVTQVRMWEDGLIREAILRELNRDGQVYFVHNFVRDIHNVANHLRTIVPEARFVVGHGQMGGSELEEVMLKFLNKEADVLVSTNIIESGLDIPSANTIFLNRAERFGLADLHQLRGRVGRSKHRAYAYMLLSPKHPVKDIAARRLKAIEHYSELGAGFQIAMRDLEIRGAGNILGAEQSGHIEAVGYEMYCQLLEQAVRRLKNEPAEPFKPVNLELGVSATIPSQYIRSERQRMEVYRRLTTCRMSEELETLRSDLRDAFGPVPDEVETLLSLAEIRVLAQPWGIRSMVLVPPDVIFAVEDFRRAEPLFKDGPGSPRVPDPKTIHWRLTKRYLEMPTLLTVLRHQLAKKAAPAAIAEPAAKP